MTIPFLSDLVGGVGDAVERARKLLAARSVPSLLDDEDETRAAPGTPQVTMGPLSPVGTNVADVARLARRGNLGAHMTLGAAPDPIRALAEESNRRDDIAAIPMRTIGAAGPRTTTPMQIPLPPKPTHELEMGGALGVDGYGLEDVGRDFLLRKNAFAADTPVGLAADVVGNVTGAVRAVPDVVQSLTEDRPGLAALQAGAAMVPFGGRVFSRLAKAIEAAPFMKATANQWLAQLTKNVAKGEREWTGIDRFLAENQGRVLSREEVQAVYDQGMVRLGEQVLGGPNPRFVAEPVGGGAWQVRNPASGEVKPADGSQHASAMARLMNRDIPARQPSRFADLTEPGGDNYREIVLTVDGIEPYRPDAVHFTDVDDGRALAWARVKDRELPNGEKVLFVEEIQSKRHQDARAKGYRGESLDAASVARVREIQTKYGRGTATPEELDELRALNARATASQKGVPDAPMKKTEEWVGLTMKRLIDEAAQGGYDRVAWTTGEQQVNRYALAKHIDEITYSPANGGLVALEKGTRNPVVAEMGVDQEKLAEFIGKDAAQKLLAQQPDRTGKLALSGEGLRLGGEGMHAFYDRMLPGWVRDYAKKLGVAIDVEPMTDHARLASRIDELHGGPITDDAAREFDDLTARRQAIEGDFSVGSLRDNPSFRVTPELRERVSQGQALWSNPVGPAVREGARLLAEHPTAGGAVVGATTGALADEENPLRGAAIGSVAGAGVGAGVRAGVGAGVRAGARAVSRAADVSEDLMGAVPRTRPEPVVPQAVAAPAGEPTPNVGTPRGADDVRFPRQQPAGERYAAPIDDGEDPRLANLSKFGLSTEGESILRGIVGDLNLTKKRISVGEMEAEAAKRATDPAALMRQQGAWDGIDALAARNFESTAVERIGTLSKAMREATATAEEKAAMQAEVSRLTDDIGILFARGAKERSDAGRTLYAYRVVAKNTMDPTTWVTLAQRARGDLPLTSDEIVKVRDLAGDRNHEGLVEFVASLHRSTNLEKMMTAWKAGLLTNPVTHVVNNSYNAGMASLETAKEPAAVVADWMISAIRGEARTKAHVTARGLVVEPLIAGGKGFKAAVEAVKEKGALGALRSAQAKEMLGKWDLRQTNYEGWIGAPVWQAYTDTVFGSLTAADRLWRGMATARALEEYLRPLAIKEAKETGASVAEIMKRLRSAPPNDLTMRAIADAEVAIFQNENRGAKAVSAFKNQLGPKGRAAADFVMPFVRTPLNVGARLVDYSPLGAVRLYKVFAKELPDQARKKLAEDLGRTATGTGLVWLGFELYRGGKMTGTAPKDATEREEWDRDGRIANAVQIEGQWVNLSRSTPYGALMALGAQMAQVAEEAKSPVGAAAGAVYTPARVALDQSFLKGVSGALSAANDPARYGERFLDNTAGSVVPAGIAAVSRGTDPVIRAPEGPLQAIAARIPGLSESVPARRTAFGDPVRREGGVLEALLSPAQRSSDKTQTDPAVALAKRLGIEARLPGRSVVENGVRRKLSQTEYQALLDESGPAQREAITRALQALAELGGQVDRPLTPADSLRALNAAVQSGRTTAYARQRARNDGRRVVGEDVRP